MGKINVLDKHIAELIAAGEVVERPSSVIKELLENSIDAGASSVTVEIKNGGISYMRVTDNGSGIMRDDVKTAFLRHATSKVKAQDDLDKISTLGFRGEALASICAVSKVELLTRSADEEIGTAYKIYGGEGTEPEDAGCPVGTTIIVRDLFYNVPARMKFLKKNVSEGNAVSAVMDKIALSHPEIAFIYIKDGKQMFKTAGNSNLKAAAYAVYGRDFVSTLISVDYELNGVRVTGYVSKPEGARPNRNMQNFFINGRYIKSRTASVALEEASKGSVMVGKFLSCVLHIRLSYGMVDVNVHPAKIEVRFVNERPIFDAVYHAVQSALLRGDDRKKIEINSKKDFPAFEVRTADPSVTLKPPKFSQKSTPDAEPYAAPIATRENILKSTLRDSSDLISPFLKPGMAPDSSITITVDDDELETGNAAASKENKNLQPGYKADDEHKNSVRCNAEISSDVEANVSDSKQTLSLVDTSSHALRYIGEAFKSYIILEKSSSELLIIDKHAAHERILYEQLKNGGAHIFAQGLLAPIVVTLNKTDYDSVIRNLKIFEALYFDVDDFGSGNVIVRAAPQFLENTDISSTVMEIAGFLSENKQDLNTEKMDWIFHSIACRGAVKAGNINSDAELIELARKVESDPNLRYCPHGRPICIVLTKHELEKHFGRV